MIQMNSGRIIQGHPAIGDDWWKGMNVDFGDVDGNVDRRAAVGGGMAFGAGRRRYQDGQVAADAGAAA